MPSTRSPRATRIVAAALLSLVTLLTACGKARNEAPSAAAQRAEGGGSKAAAAPAATAAASAAAPGGKDKKGEVKTWQRARLPANAARLSIGDHDVLPLVGAEAHVRLDGFRARVVLDYYFHNPHGSGLEGTFQLRLPTDASPYFFAFGAVVAQAGGPPPFLPAERKAEVEPAGLLAERATTWSQPKEARMVPRERAVVAYEDNVRQRVDPALVEWAGAGVFNARVFPLEGGKVHRIVLGYDVDLVRAGDDLVLSLDVPEGARSNVVELSALAPAGSTLDVHYGEPSTSSEGPEVAAQDRDGRKLYRVQDKPGGTLTARVRKAAQPVVLAGADPRTGPYFAVQLRADLPASKAASAERAVFLIDTSLSSSPDKYNVWLAMMEALLENNRDAMKRFAVLFFNVTQSWYKPAFLDNTKENVAALMAFAKTLSLEGATDLGAALAQAGRPRWVHDVGARWDVFLLSDGAATWGESEPFAISRALSGGNASALFAYQTGLAGTESGLLDHLARESGGAVFSVVGEAEIAAASRAHRARSFALGKVEVPGGSDLLIAGRPRVIFPGQRLIVAGRGTPEKGSELAITVSDGGKESVLRVKLDAPLASPLAPRAYGQIAVAGLEELGASTEPLATTYATYFRVTGRTTSLLMLESEEAYARSGVKPEEPDVVKKTEAAGAIATALRAIGDALGDPKAGFFAWLDRLERAPGMRFAPPRAVREALATLPSSTFAVIAPPLEAKLQADAALPGAYRELLATRQMDYEAVTAEAERRLGAAGPADALRALSSLVEESPGDAVLARDVAFSAMAYGLGGHAYHLFRRVAASRPHEPQTYRAMAACLVEMKLVDLALAYYEVGLAGEWDGRFGDFRRILGLEYLHTLRRIAAGELKTTLGAFAAQRLAEIESVMMPKEADLLVMITWNTDHTDVDLHVVEPGGEECYYGHRRTKQGGELTADVTQGYGPEMYVLPKAHAGQYRIQAHYYAADRTRQGTRTKVQVLVFERWGTKGERVSDKVVTLARGKDKHDVATVTLE